MFSMVKVPLVLLEFYVETSYNVNEEHSCAADNVFGSAGCNLSLRNNETLTLDAIERTHRPL